VTIGLYQINFIVPALPAGTHAVVARIAGFSSNSVSISVGAGAGIIVSQNGFTFQAVQGARIPPPKQLRIISATGGAVNVTVTASTTSGGNWLAPLNQVVNIPTTTNLGMVNITADPTNLAPGDYYGTLTLTAPGVPNSPQVVTVVLNVNAANVNPGPILDPTGLVFVRLAGGANPPGQVLLLTNLTARPLPFNAVTDFAGGPRWFSIPPLAGNIGANVQSAVQVTADVALPAGVYRGSITFNFPADNITLVADLVLVVTPEVELAAQKAADRREAGACTATRLLPVFRLLGANFNTPTAWPTPLEVQVVDDCGAAMRNGAVTTEFSNGDSPLPLLPALDGRWSGTWVPVNPRSSNLQVTVRASQQDRKIEGMASVGGAVQQNIDIPIVNANGVVSAASYSTRAQPSPGEIVSIFGLQLSDGIQSSDSLPLKTQLSTTVATMAGRALPLIVVSSGQVNAVIPYDVPTPVAQQLIVRRGNRLSTPVQVNVLPAQPGIFTTDLSGRGQGHVYVIPAANLQVLADGSNPAKAGDFLVIYCGGLGAVTPPLPAGSVVPFDVLRMTANPVTVTVGGKAAQVDFAGLTPGLTGLYQVNIRMPEGVEAGDAVPVVMTVTGVSSPPVTIAAR
jgi:uncharacterized protein (TIGR03437 family)